MAEPKLIPLGDRVVVEPIEKEETTAAGIYVPETAKEKPQEGMVVAVGPGRVLDNGQRAPMEIKEKDKIIFAKYAGMEFKMGDKKLLILSDKDILAVIK
ncbi:MAG: co-chaperone GroES [Chloroflexi bacterium]|nr:co-chaperone GroES [Chloroflexota bacterium]